MGAGAIRTAPGEATVALGPSLCQETVGRPPTLSGPR